LSVVSTADSVAFDATPAPTLTGPDAGDVLAEAETEGLAPPLGEVLALADDAAVGAAEVAVVGLAGGWAVLCLLDRETRA
jgi:hypothetical protein